jgi:hypothetical protein
MSSLSHMAASESDVEFDVANGGGANGGAGDSASDSTPLLRKPGGSAPGFPPLVPLVPPLAPLRALTNPTPEQLQNQALLEQQQILLQKQMTLLQSHHAREAHAREARKQRRRESKSGALSVDSTPETLGGSDAAAQAALAKRDKAAKDNSSLLAWSFVAMTIIGLGNRIFGKLQVGPERASRASEASE